jgi:thioredoxin reductase
MVGMRPKFAPASRLANENMSTLLSRSTDARKSQPKISITAQLYHLETVVESENAQIERNLRPKHQQAKRQLRPIRGSSAGLSSPTCITSHSFGKFTSKVIHDMISDIVRLLFRIITFLPPFAITALRQRISATYHKHSYKAFEPSQTKNVIVLGGSFAGYQTTKRLTETLPSGYRVVLVEKNSHLNYLFAFPRFSVVKGYEQYAFIPYSSLAKGVPRGISSLVQDTVVDVSEKHVMLKSGEKLEYAYLVITTGTSSALPSKVASTESGSAQKELRGMQDRIAAAGRIAVVGGGAVGVELASDIKDFYPDKDVTLIHSRERLLPTFGEKLHTHVLKRLEEMGITVLLNERPTIPTDSTVLKFHEGQEKTFDLIVSKATQLYPRDLLTSYRSHAQASVQTPPSYPPYHQPQYPNNHPTSSSNQLSISSTPASRTSSPAATSQPQADRKWHVQRSSRPKSSYITSPL